MTDLPIPCLFCSGKAFPEPPSLGRSHWNVVCDDCGASGPHGHDEGQAIRRWNECVQKQMPCRRCNGRTWYTNFGPRGVEHQVPCAYCNPKGLPVNEAAA